MIKAAQKARVESKDPLEIARRVLSIEADAVRGLLERLDGNFAAAVQLIAGRKGRVVVSGMGKSGHIARKIASTLASTGTPAYFVHPAEASHGDLGMIAPGDAVLALSNSGDTAELRDLLAELRDQIDHIELTGPLRRIESPVLAGISQLPVRVVPRCRRTQ